MALLLSAPTYTTIDQRREEREEAVCFLERKKFVDFRCLLFIFGACFEKAVSVFLVFLQTSRHLLLFRIFQEKAKKSNGTHLWVSVTHGSVSSIVLCDWCSKPVETKYARQCGGKRYCCLLLDVY